MAAPTRRGIDYGKGIDLGAILMAAFGGVTANPEYALAQDAQTANVVMKGSPTEAALRNGAQNQPFKPKTFIDRNAASGANADYLANEGSADSASLRRIEELRKMLPMQNEAELDVYKQKGDYDLGNTRTLDKERFNMDTEAARQKAILGVLQSNNIAPNDFDIKKYMSDVNPEQIKALLQGLSTKMSTDKATMADTGRDQMIKESTFPDTLSTAQKVSAQEAGQVDELYDFKKLLREQQLKNNESGMVKDRYLNSGDAVLDLQSPGGPKPVYTKPTDLEKYRQGLITSPTQQTGQPQAQAEPMVEVTIDGMKVRIPASAAARLSQQ